MSTARKPVCPMRPARHRPEQACHRGGDGAFGRKHFDVPTGRHLNRRIFRMPANRTVSGVRTRRAKLPSANATSAERRLWRHLRARRLAGCSFQRQEPIGPYIVDFACLKRRLVVEVDGNSHESRVEYDWLRTQYLKRLGYRVVRFSNDRVLLETRAVLRSILRHLSAPKRPPMPGRRRLTPLRRSPPRGGSPRQDHSSSGSARRKETRAHRTARRYLRASPRNR